MTDRLLRVVIREALQKTYHRPSQEFLERSQRPVEVEIHRNYRLPEEFSSPRHLQIVAQRLMGEVNDMESRLRSVGASDEEIAEDLGGEPPALPVGALRILISRLANLNPEIRDLLGKTPSLSRSYGVILGIASGFTPRDIAFFEDDWKGLSEEPEWRRKWSEVKELYGVGDDVTGWIPSHETLDELISTASD